jgi:hypothetical protein
VAGAVYEGGETRLGCTYWQSIDASASSAVVAQALKLAFSRVRPADNNDPNLWFKGHGNQSFPSGEVTEVSSIVTPFMLASLPMHVREALRRQARVRQCSAGEHYGRALAQMRK